MNFKRIGNKRDEVYMTVQNNDINTAVSGIGPGVPLILQFPGPQSSPQISSGTVGEDGLGVILPSSSSAAGVAQLFYGINTQQMNLYNQGAAIVNGFYKSAAVVLQTRAGSTAAWAATTLTPLAGLDVDTVNNAFSVGTVTRNSPVVLLPAISATGTASNATVTTNTNTLAASASATSDTRTVITIAARVYVRNM